MRKIRVNQIWYKRIYFIMGIIMPIFILLFTFSFFLLIYQGILTKDYTQISYTLFAANAITCNCLLAFGRSPIFLKRFNDFEQSLMYHSAAMFLYSTIISFFVSAYIYVNTDKGFGGNDIQNSLIGHWIIIISITIGLGISILFSISGLIFFVRWAKKAIHKSNEEIGDAV